MLSVRTQDAIRTFGEAKAGRLIRAGRIIHPFPTALNVVAVLVLAAVANDGLPSIVVLFRLGGAMFFVQAAIGASNDYCDRDLDAHTKPFKPIVRGLLEPKTALRIAVLCVLAAGTLAATLSAWSVLVGAIGLAAGLAYNARLKRSLLSALPFMIALPLLPIWVWVSLDTFDVRLLWLLPFGPLAGLAVHLSNTLPDLERDRQAGMRGLAHTLGRRSSVRLAWGSFGAALVLAAALGAPLDYDWRVFAAAETAATLLLATAVAAYGLRPGPASLQLGFGLIGAATAALAAGWLAALP